MLAYSPRLPIHLGQWLFVADFVAVHSCEGSGGITPRFPLTSGASCLSKRKLPEFRDSRNLSRQTVQTSRRSYFQSLRLCPFAPLREMFCNCTMGSRKDRKETKPQRDIKKLPNFQQVDSIYEAGIDRRGRGGEPDSRNTKRPRSPM